MEVVYSGPLATMSRLCSTEFASRPAVVVCEELAGEGREDELGDELWLIRRVDEDVASVNVGLRELVVHLACRVFVGEAVSLASLPGRDTVRPTVAGRHSQGD